MSFSQIESTVADQRVSPNNAPRLLIVHCTILFAVLGLAVGISGSPALISDTVQAEFVGFNPASAAPMMLARPALATQTARAN
jgi:membrane protein implicated in regulation of membrane protease activity